MSPADVALIEHVVRRQLGELGERARDERRARELRGDLVGALLGAIGDRELGGLLGEQRPDDAARRAAGAEHDDPAAGERLALVDGDVANEADAVGVVAVQAAVDDADRVDGAGGVRRRAFSSHSANAASLCGTVTFKPFAAGRAEAAHGRFERRRARRR